MTSMKHKYFALSIILTIVVLSIAIVTFYVISQPKKVACNTHLHFNNATPGYLNETSSIIMSIDGKVIYNNNDIAKAKDKAVSLSDGEHTITISNTMKDMNAAKSFTVKKNKDVYLYISYNYNPEYDVYLPFYRKNYLAHLIQKNKNIDSLATKTRINSLIDIGYLKTSGYKPEAPNFKIRIQDYRNMID